MEYDEIYLNAAIAQAKKSLREGGIPIGAALVVDQTLVGLGHNRRVQLDDPIRVGLFARRFSPAICVALDTGARLDRDSAGWVAAPGTRRLTRTGRLREISNA